MVQESRRRESPASQIGTVFSRRRSMLPVLFSRRMVVSLLMGFSCGLPLLLTSSLLQAWMTEEKIDLSVIGLMALVGLPYALKFIWAPFLDRYTLPFFGRRRGWLVAAQIALAGSIGGMGAIDPKQLWTVASAAFLVTFFSATQDIVVDAYRREDLSDAELGLGSALYVKGYRIGMLLASGGGLILADHVPYSMVYLLLAACMIPGIVTTLYTPEPPLPADTPHSLREAVIEPLREYFTRNGAVWILMFILLYKVGDTMASTMTTPFYLQMGFTKTEIGTVVKLFGFWATIGGTMLGGLLMLYVGISRSLWIFGLLQAISTACFMTLTQVGPQVPVLASVIAFENFSGGMGTAAFMAFMASMTDKRFTATQYALLSSLMGVPRVVTSAPAGILAEFMGWNYFFLFCAAIALPGLMLLLKLSQWGLEGWTSTHPETGSFRRL